jgi:uncharacterized protein YuzE
MTIQYFEDTDTLLITLKKGEVSETRDLDENAQADFDAQGNLVGLTAEHVRGWHDPLDAATFCNECGRDLEKTKKKYCNKECERGFNGRRNSKRDQRKRIVTGVISELLVAADLLKREHQVFRAQHPDAKVDLFIDLGARALRVECKTGRLGGEKQMKVTFSGDSEADQEKPPYQVLAVALDGGKVVYKPDPARWNEDPLPKNENITKRTIAYTPPNASWDKRIKKVQVSRDCGTLRITLRDRSVVEIPVGLFPELEGVALDELRRVVRRDGLVVRWPRLGLEGTAEQIFDGRLVNAPAVNPKQREDRPAGAGIAF